jgi:hypothetical protein
VPDILSILDFKSPAGGDRTALRIDASPCAGRIDMPPTNCRPSRAVANRKRNEMREARESSGGFRPRLLAFALAGLSRGAGSHGHREAIVR